MTRRAALRSTVAELERTWSALGGDDDHRGNGRGLEGNPTGGNLHPIGRTGTGNPNHDAEGKFASSPGGGHGKHHAKRQRRRKRKLARLKAGYKRDIAELRARHKGERRELLKDQRADHKDMTKEHRKQRKALPGELKTARKELLKEQAQEKKDLGWSQRKEARDTERQHARELQRHDTAHAKRIEKAPPEHHEAMHAAHAESRKVIEAEHAEERANQAEVHKADRENMIESHRDARKEMVEEQSTAREDLREQQKYERAQQRESHRADRQSLRETHHDERRELMEGIKDELHETYGFKSKGAKGGRPADTGTQQHNHQSERSLGRAFVGDQCDFRQAGQNRSQTRRLASGRTHKASSAESILQHCLRRLGLTARWRDGKMTATQALKLLACIREYCRGWMRHEAETLFAVHGRDDEAVLHGGSRAMASSMEGTTSAVAPDSLGETRALTATLRHHVGRFFSRARQFVRESIIAGALALGGPGGLGADDLVEADRHADAQVAFLDRFEVEAGYRTPDELAAPGTQAPQPMSAAQFVARAEQYGGAVWPAALEIERRGVIRSGRAKQERRFHRRPTAQDHPCATCAAESAKGWVPVGTLLPIGDSECLGIMCDCYFSYLLDDGSYYITGRGWRRAA